MNQIYDPAGDYNAGLDFNYAVWTAETRVDLCNVPWNNDARDIVKFDNRAALDSYLDAGALPRVPLTKMSRVRATEPVRINIPFSMAQKYNYLRVTNPIQPVPGYDFQKSFYYFITNVRDIAPNTVELVLQLDVWQSYGFDVTFGNCYVERGHIGIANENQFVNYGRNYLCIPEGLDTGSDMRVVDYRNKQIFASVSSGEPVGTYNILVCSAVDLLADPGTATAPKVNSAKGGNFSAIPSGATYYLFRNAASLQTYLTAVQTKPWVAQGITSITIIPDITRYYPSWTWGTSGIPQVAPTSAPNTASYNLFPNWRDSIINKLPAKYRHLKKFLTFPYLAVLITTWNATPIIAKPEVWNDDDAKIIERVNLIPPAQRIQFVPYRYNASAPALDVPFVGYEDGGDFLDFATLVQSFPQVAIVNNMASMYMAANANQIVFQQGSADWSQQRALAAASTGYDQASSGIEMMNRLADTAMKLDTSATASQIGLTQMQGIVGGIASVGQGATGGMVGGAKGAAVGGSAGLVSAIAGNVLSGAEQANQASQLSSRMVANRENVESQTDNAGYVRDTNRALASFAARGDYENTIAGINAKVQDSKFVQPSVVGQVGGDTMNIVNVTSELSVRFKMIDEARIKVIGDYWLRYGYAVHQFMKIPSSLQVMEKFTYWKLSETYISGAMPEAMKQIIRGTFEKGVTVWKNPDDIGRVDISDNAPLEGISF